MQQRARCLKHGVLCIFSFASSAYVLACKAFVGINQAAFEKECLPSLARSSSVLLEFVRVLNTGKHLTA